MLKIYKASKILKAILKARMKWEKKSLKIVVENGSSFQFFDISIFFD